MTTDEILLRIFKESVTTLQIREGKVVTEQFKESWDEFCEQYDRNNISSVEYSVREVLLDYCLDEVIEKYVFQLKDR